MAFEPLIFVGIDYDEFDPETYRGVIMTVGIEGETVCFDSPNGFDADQEAAKNWLAVNHPDSLAVCESSFDQYQSDRESNRSPRSEK